MMKLQKAVPDPEITQRELSVSLCMLTLFGLAISQACRPSMIF